jgi:hypothetical protein
MSREISYLVRHVVTLPDNFPASAEPTNTTIEFVTNEAIYHELTGRYDPKDIAVTSERLDK